nr:DUF5658 family protein [Clostridium swellfunianum]
MLNISDIILTLLLLDTGVFMEANIFMKALVKSEIVSFFIKFGVPLVLLYVVYRRIKLASEKQLQIGNTLINGCLIFYSLINLSHLFWILQYSIHSI